MPQRKSSKALASQKKSRNSKADMSNDEQRNTKKQSNSGLSGSGVNRHVYQYTGKQTKNWKPLNKNLKEYILKLIDSSVKTVGSKPQFSDNRDVQKILLDLKSRLKGQIEVMHVPNKKYGDHTKLKSLSEDLTVELEELKTQELLLEKSIREEERELEALECLQETVEENTTLDIQIPSDVLGLPCISTRQYPTSSCS